MGYTDPHGRQTVIGLGHFLELLRLAALADGYQVYIIPFPQGEFGYRPDHRPVVHVIFQRQPDIVPDPLFLEVLKRRSHKAVSCT